MSLHDFAADDLDNRASDFIPPYPPSWLDRMIVWIDRQPGPAWVPYGVGTLLLAILSIGAHWLYGGPFEPQKLAFALYPGYFVGLTHYLDRQALQALEAFRPAMIASQADFRRIRYELTTVPATAAWIVTALFPLPMTYVFVIASLPVVQSPRQLPEALLSIGTTLLTAAAFVVLILHTVRQLRMVSRLHAMATNIDLLQPRPTYAFSRLTSQSALGVVSFLYFDFLINPPSPGTSLPYLTLMAVIFVVEGLAFFLPLLGMHGRLTREKARLEFRGEPGGRNNLFGSEAPGRVENVRRRRRC